MEWPDECRIVCTFDYSQMSIIEITSVFANPIVVLKEREGCTCRYQESGYNTTLKTHFILTLISSSICCNCFSYSCFFVSSVSLYEAKYHLLPPWVAYWPCRACGKASSSPWNWATPSHDSNVHTVFMDLWFFIYFSRFSLTNTYGSARLNKTTIIFSSSRRFSRYFRFSSFGCVFARRRLMSRICFLCEDLLSLRYSSSIQLRVECVSIDRIITKKPWFWYPARMS